ncbi:MAG TPA: MHYT domain-containing protein [Rhizomicrobium sp.]|nr:MHYT domain-containing protein [Rhizomicrobium sp.]
MLHVLGCITQQHDARLVGLATVLCFFACFTAMSMIGRARGAEKRARLMWLGAAAFAAGSGIWATHFVAMLAYMSPLTMGFDIHLTMLSALVAIVLSGAGYWMSLTRPGPLLGGIVVGAGIGAMHYIGMAAVEIRADAIWNPAYVVASILLGVCLTAPVMYVAREENSWRGMTGAALLFTLAIVSMHFTGMSALVYRPDPLVAAGNVVMAPTMLALAVAPVAFLIMAFGLIGSLIDHHLERQAEGEAEKLRRYIEELEKAKQELLIAKAQAEAGNRAKSSFLANMSHELRTPLNAIIGFTDLMRQQVLGPIQPAKYQGYIADVHQSGEHLLNLINDILDLAKIEAGRRELQVRPVDLASLARQALVFVQSQAEKRQILLSSEIGPIGMIKGDERALLQVLTNLLSNAVKFSHPGGRVILFARDTPDGGIALGVEDEGPGMSPEGLKKALEPFGQASDMWTVEGSGTGLGLPIVKGLVETQGGIFHLESQVGRGTRAWAEFPADRLDRQQRAA